MFDISAAKTSPRFDNGVLYWYQGDTWDLTLALEFVDQDGEPVVINADDTLVITFRDYTGAVVKTYTFMGITNNTVILQLDATASVLFGRGRYTYKAVLTHGYVTTISVDNICVVE